MAQTMSDNNYVKYTNDGSATNVEWREESQWSDGVKFAGECVD